MISDIKNYYHHMEETEPPPMTKLCPSLSRQRILCCDRIPLSRFNSVVCTQGLSCAPGLVCRRRLAWSVARAWPPPLPHNTTPNVVRTSLLTLSFVLCGRSFFRGQLCLDRNSPYPGQLNRGIELLCRDIISPCLGQLYRDIKILSRDRKSSQPSQLCHDIELLCRNTKPLHLTTLYCDKKPLHHGQLCCDIKTFIRDRKLLAWPTLSRHKILCRYTTVFCRGLKSLDLTKVLS